MLAARWQRAGGVLGTFGDVWGSFAAVRGIVPMAKRFFTGRHLVRKEYAGSTGRGGAVLVQR